MSEMTIEEARRILIDIADQMPSDVCADWIDAVCIGIKAIDTQLMRDATKEERKSVKDYIESISKPTGVQFEAQPCEDCISREHAKQFLYYEIEHLHDDSLYDCFARIIDDMYNELPSVTPQPFINKPCVSEGVCREDKIQVLEKIRAEIVDLGRRTMNDNRAGGIWACRDILDKYKAESEDKE